jgi:hypothetical protein
MEIEATTTEIAVPRPRVPNQGAADADFGSRRQTGRPHSINLFGSPSDGAGNIASHSAQLLLGVGIGAALMFYLDKDRGSRRRSVLGDALEELALTVIGRVVRQARGG